MACHHKECRWHAVVAKHLPIMPWRDSTLIPWFFSEYFLWSLKEEDDDNSTTSQLFTTETRWACDWCDCDCDWCLSSLTSDTIKCDFLGTLLNTRVDDDEALTVELLDSWWWLFASLNNDDELRLLLICDDESVVTRKSRMTEKQMQRSECHENVMMKEKRNKRRSINPIL